MTGTIKNYTNNRVSSLTSGAFYRYLSLKTVDFPACVTIGNSAFYNCTSLSTINFPVCTSIGESAFYNCIMTNATFPVCTTVSKAAFFNCKKLSVASFNQATTFGSNAFQDCILLKDLSCDNLVTLNASALQKCSVLSVFSTAKLQNIGSYAFLLCRTLQKVVLGSTTVCALSNSNAFSSTPFMGYSAYFTGTPYIYVPASLVDTYKSATNWVYFSSYFSSIESLSPTLITFTIDGESYQAEEGMTWRQWAESEYSNESWYIDVMERVKVTQSSRTISDVESTDLIVANQAYSTYIDDDTWA